MVFPAAKQGHSSLMCCLHVLFDVTAVNIEQQFEFPPPHNTTGWSAENNFTGREILTRSASEVDWD